MKRLVIAEELEEEEEEYPIVDDYNDLLDYVSKEDLRDIVEQIVDGGEDKLIWNFEIFDEMDEDMKENMDFSDWLFCAFKIKGNDITQEFYDGIEDVYGYLDIQCDLEMLIEDIVNNDSSLKTIISGDIEMAFGEYKHDSNVYNAEDSEYDADDVDELAEIEDKVGTEIKLGPGFDVDRGNREAPFVYIDGDIIIGTYKGEGSCHTDLVNQYFDTNKDNNIRTRNLNQVEGDHSKTPFASGHISRGIAFIDECHNCTKEEVAKALKAEDNFPKIYDYDYENLIVKRLARRIRA